MSSTEEVKKETGDEMMERSGSDSCRRSKKRKERDEHNPGPWKKSIQGFLSSAANAALGIRNLYTSPKPKRNTGLDTSTSCIWDTTTDPDLKDHPLLQTAFHLVNETAEIPSVSGTFGLKKLEKGITSFCAAHGIWIDETLVRHSTDYVLDKINLYNGSIDELFDDLNVISFIAVLQENIFHALDLKQRAQITGQNHFLGPARGFKCKMLKMKSDVGSLPVQLQFDNDDDAETLTKKHILRHIDYQYATSHNPVPCSKKRHEGDEVNSARTRSAVIMDNLAMSAKRRKQLWVSSSENPPDPETNRGLPPPWLKRIQVFLPSAVNTAMDMHAEKQRKRKVHHNDNGDPLKTGGRLTPQRLWAAKNCKFVIEFCDSDKTKKKYFYPQEEIFLLLTVTNTSEDTVIGIPRGMAFGPTGVLVKIEGLKQGRVGILRIARMILVPGESYTFFRQFTKTTEDDDVAYGTNTLPPGEYNAKVEIFEATMKESFPFRVLFPIPSPGVTAPASWQAIESSKSEQQI